MNPCSGGVSFANRMLMLGRPGGGGGLWLSEAGLETCTGSGCTVDVVSLRMMRMLEVDWIV